MKVFGLWVLLFVFGATSLICLCSPPPSCTASHKEVSMKLKVHQSRKLKENMNVDGYEGDAAKIDLLDYRWTDPVPSSKASIRHGPIQHDVPLIPYIPKPSPPEPNPHNHVDVVLP